MTERQFVIGDREAAQISTFCEIARVNGSLLNLGEILEVTSLGATEDELRLAWALNPGLSSRYSIEGSWVVDRESDGQGNPSSGELENRRRTVENVRLAREFASSCKDDRVALMAVSGGNSYRSARSGDDIDFFAVTRNDSVWIFMLRSLLLARIKSFGKSGRAPFCFSYVVEEQRAVSEFSRPHDGLFARDALMAEVINGEGFYQALLSRAGWMESQFPSLYNRRLREARSEGPEPKSRSGNRVLNSFLFYTVGSYVRLKAYLLNRHFRAHGRKASVFRADLGKDRCIYESNRYLSLRGMYAAFEAPKS